MTATRVDNAPGRAMGFERSRIVLVNRYYYPDQSATSQLLADLAAALANAGFVVHVICSRQRYDDPRARLVRREIANGVTIHRVWTTRFGRRTLPGRALDYATFYFSSTLAMMRLLNRGDTLVAKTDPPLLSIPAMMVARIRGARLINWLQDIFPEVATLLGANPLPRAFTSILCRWRDRSLKAAQVNVVLGNKMRERLLELGIPEEKIRVIENWAELDSGEPLPTGESRLRSHVGLSDEFVVGYSGNLGRAHEFETLLGAAELLKSDAKTVFLMIGGGTGMRQLSREVDARGLCNFRFLPYQPRESLSDCLAAADVHWVSLLPELEGFIVPSKFYGILAAARPVVFIGASDGELGRIIIADGCGAVVGVGHPADLAQLLIDWKAESSHCERMGSKGYQLYSERYGARRAFDRWIRILDTSRVQQPQHGSKKCVSIKAP